MQYLSTFTTEILVTVYKRQHIRCWLYTHTSPRNNWPIAEGNQPENAKNGHNAPNCYESKNKIDFNWVWGNFTNKALVRSERIIIQSIKWFYLDLKKENFGDSELIRNKKQADNRKKVSTRRLTRIKSITWYRNDFKETWLTAAHTPTDKMQRH